MVLGRPFWYRVLILSLMSFRPASLGQSILDSASSIDAHIDAGALVDRIGAKRREPVSLKKALARRFSASSLKHTDFSYQGP